VQVERYVSVDELLFNWYFTFTSSEEW